MHPVQINTLPLHTKFRKMKEPKEIYFLPVEQLSDDAIQCIEKVCELLDAIKMIAISITFLADLLLLEKKKLLVMLRKLKKIVMD